MSGRLGPIVSRDFWAIDEVQFPRLLAEIKAVGLTKEQVNCLAVSMDLSSEEIYELLDRAEARFDEIINDECKSPMWGSSVGSDEGG